MLIKTEGQEEEEAQKAKKGESKPQPEKDKAQDGNEKDSDTKITYVKPYLMSNTIVQCAMLLFGLVLAGDVTFNIATTALSLSVLVIITISWLLKAPVDLVATYKGFATQPCSIPFVNTLKVT